MPRSLNFVVFKHGCTALNSNLENGGLKPYHADEYGKLMRAPLGRGDWGDMVQQAKEFMTMQEYDYDAVLTTEEIISPEEFLRRREAGDISPEKVKILSPNPSLPFGGFKVKLNSPIYTVPFEKGKRHVRR